MLLAACACLPTSVRALEVDNFPKLRAFVGDMAATHGMAVSVLDRLFGQVELQPQIIDTINRPREDLPWYQYEKTFVTPEMIRAGVKFWNANAHALLEAQTQFGVDPQVIVAILGIETHYGRNVGQFRIVDALTTLMLEYPERSDFFRNELEQYLLLTQELHIDPLSIKGSYAGAIGTPQFMPSSYRRYAVDFDGDHRRDMLRGSTDAIGSVANYLKQHGWRRGELICDDARTGDSMYIWRDNGADEPKLTLGGLKKYGVVPVRYNNLNELAAAISLESEAGPTQRLCYHNFFVITSYNLSTRYAMAVYDLARLLYRQYNDGET